MESDAKIFTTPVAREADRVPVVLRLLEETLPGSYASDGLLGELRALREKFAAVELSWGGRVARRAKRERGRLVIL
jgi:hypothetical protein